MKLEDKFIVINKKRFDELNENTRNSNCNCREAMCIHESSFPSDCKEIQVLNKALLNFKKAYELRVHRKMNQKYIVCNQDEPYFKRIKNIILNNK